MIVVSAEDLSSFRDLMEQKPGFDPEQVDRMLNAMDGQYGAEAQADALMTLLRAFTYTTLAILKGVK